MRGWDKLAQAVAAYQPPEPKAPKPKSRPIRKAKIKTKAIGDAELNDSLDGLFE